MGLFNAAFDIQDERRVVFINIEAVAVYSENAIGHKIAQFIRVGDHFFIKAYGEPSSARVIIYDIHQSKQSAILFITILSAGP